MSAIISLPDWEAENKSIPDSEKRLFLTENQIRAYPQFKDTSAEEIINIINSLHQLALLTYELVSTELNESIGILKAA